MKKLYVVLTIMILIISVFCGTVAADGEQVLMDVPATVSCDENFTIVMKIGNVNDLSGLSLDMVFDPNQVNVNSITLHSIFGDEQEVSEAVNNIDNTQGLVEYCCVLLGGGNGTNITVPVDAISIDCTAQSDTGDWSIQMTDDPLADLVVDQNNVRVLLSDSNAQPITTNLPNYSITIERRVESVTLSSNEEAINIDATFMLTATVLPNDATYPQVTWSSSNTDVATVEQNGLVTAVGLGEATITATADGESGTCIVTVDPISVSSVTLSSESETMHIDDTVTLTVEVLPEDATYPGVTWSSSNTDVATVDQSGLVTAIGAGEATITATADGVSDTCMVIVEEPGFTDEIINGKLYRTYYNEDDSIEKVVIYYSVDDSSVIYKIIYYTGGVRTSYEEYNESGALAKRVYLYSDGKQKRRELYNTDTGVWYSISEYDSSGQLIKKKYMHSNGKLRLCEFYSSSTGNKYAVSEYDADGRIMKKTYLYSSGVRKKIEYYSTSTGNKYAVSEYRTNGKIEKKTYLYSSGVRKKIEYYSSTTGNKYAVSEYRTNGKIEKKTYLYSSGVRKKIYYYSSTTGNKFAVSEYRTNGSLAKKTYLYSSGVRKMIHYYSSTTGNKFATSYYDTNGDITHKEYFNSDGSVRETIYY